jgi:hypothetical protein
MPAMSTPKNIDISLLRLNDAHQFSPLLAAYVQSLKRGAPRRPDDFYAETLLQDRVGADVRRAARWRTGRFRDLLRSSGSGDRHAAAARSIISMSAICTARWASPRR